MPWHSPLLLPSPLFRSISRDSAHRCSFGSGDCAQQQARMTPIWDLGGSSFGAIGIHIPQKNWSQGATESFLPQDSDWLVSMMFCWFFSTHTFENEPNFHILGMSWHHQSWAIWNCSWIYLKTFAHMAAAQSARPRSILIHTLDPHDPYIHLYINDTIYSLDPYLRNTLCLCQNSYGKWQ